MRFALTAKLAAAAMGLAALCAAPIAQAHESVYYSVNARLAPGLSIGISNAPIYVPPQPVYIQQQPVYAAPAPVYVQSQPVYVQGRGYGGRYVEPGWRNERWERERMVRERWQKARGRGNHGYRGGHGGEERGHGGHRD